jgi:hypothetical protein
LWRQRADVLGVGRQQRSQLLGAVHGALEGCIARFVQRHAPGAGVLGGGDDDGDLVGGAGRRDLVVGEARVGAALEDEGHRGVRDTREAEGAGGELAAFLLVGQRVWHDLLRA